MKITDYPSVDSLTDGDVILIDGNNGTKKLVAGGDISKMTSSFVSSDNASETDIITSAGGETSMTAMTSRDTHGGLFGGLSKAMLNTRKLINTVKRIWQTVANAWVSGAKYSVGQIVTYTNGHTYICKLEHISSSSIMPGNTTYWEDKTIGDMIASLNTRFYTTNGKTNFPINNIAYTVYRFVAPESGIYLLRFDITGTYNSSVYLNVKKNSETVAANTGSWIGSPTASSAVIVNLTTNDSITFDAACSVATDTIDRSWHFNAIKLNG